MPFSGEPQASTGLLACGSPLNHSGLYYDIMYTIYQNED